MVKNPPANVEDAEDAVLIPRWGRSPAGGHSSLLQYPCLENPMDRGVWQAKVHRVTRVGHDFKSEHKMYRFQQASRDNTSARGGCRVWKLPRISLLLTGRGNLALRPICFLWA